MWLLTFLPDSLLLFIINAVLLAGVGLLILAFFVKIIPFVNMYRLPLQITGVVLFTLGVYLRGGYAIEQEWRERVRALEAAVAQAEKKSAELNVSLASEIAKKRQARRDLKAALDQQIQDQREEINADCTLSPEAVRAYNNAVRGSVR